MTFIDSCLVITFFGIIGMVLRRNLLTISLSLLQFTIGLNSLVCYLSTSQDHFFANYWLLAIVFVFIIYLSAISLLLIKRRSTLQVHELTELRG